MRITFQSQPENKTRFFIRISEFSFESCPVQINHVFRAVPAPQTSFGKRHALRRSLSNAVGAFVVFRKGMMARGKFYRARRRATAVISQL